MIEKEQPFELRNTSTKKLQVLESQRSSISGVVQPKTVEPAALDIRPFIKTFNDIAPYRNRYEVFHDFVKMAAISLHNAVKRNEKLEQNYLQIIGRYESKNADQFPKLLGDLVMLLDPAPRDVLGCVFMELEIGNDRAGQFFTPSSVSEMMAQILYGDSIGDLNKPFITLSEPACGSGGMVLAFAKEVIRQGHNPAEKMWVQCIDVDPLAAYMCYLQLSLWNIPAEIIIGNTLSLEFREILYTPAHYLGCWDSRLRFREALEATNALIGSDEIACSSPEIQTKPERNSKVPAGTNLQFDFEI